MAALDYFTEAKHRDFVCRSCGWNGDSSAASMETFDELFELNCPMCDARLALVLYPTDQDIRVAAEAGDPEAISMLKRIQ